MVENPVKSDITKSQKNLNKQDKTDLNKQTLSGCSIIIIIIIIIIIKTLFNVGSTNIQYG